MFAHTSNHAIRALGTSHRPKLRLDSYIPMPMPMPSARFREIAMDFVGPLPRSRSFDSVVVITDRLTNYVKIKPTKTSVTAPEIADLFYRTWYRQFGLPTAITSDRDKLFIGRFWKELMKKVDVHLQMSMAYHPETDGSSKR